MWALPVGYPPVNWETFAFAWLLLSSARDSPQPGQRRPIGPSRRDRSAAEAVGAGEGLARALLWEEPRVTSHGRHLPFGACRR